MNALETRIPPPLAGLLMGVVAWLASSAFAPTTLPFLVRLGSAIAFVVLGLALAGAGARTVSRAKTTLNPIRPDTSTALATSGIYAYTRNQWEPVTDFSADRWHSLRLVVRGGEFSVMVDGSAARTFPNPIVNPSPRVYLGDGFEVDYMRSNFGSEFHIALDSLVTKVTR